MYLVIMLERVLVVMPEFPPANIPSTGKSVESSQRDDS